jgi:hypothetical protein
MSSMALKTHRKFAPMVTSRPTLPGDAHTAPHHPVGMPILPCVTHACLACPKALFLTHARVCHRHACEGTCRGETLQWRAPLGTLCAAFRHRVDHAFPDDSPASLAPEASRHLARDAVVRTSHCAREDRGRAADQDDHMRDLLGQSRRNTQVVQTCCYRRGEARRETCARVRRMALQPRQRDTTGRRERCVLQSAPVVAPRGVRMSWNVGRRARILRPPWSTL